MGQARWSVLLVLALGLPAPGAERQHVGRGNAPALMLPAPGSERQIAVEPGVQRVKRFEKIEFSFRAETVGANPYDPGEIDLCLELTSPGGKKLTIPAFYFQPYEREQRTRGRRTAEWLYPAGPPAWKARFAPTEVGTYRGVAILKDRAGAARSGPVALECIPSAAKGFVRVSARDPRYLALDDGSPFFAVGQNVAFVTDSYATAAMIRKLGENGANFARIWACSEDWAVAIEARKSAWGRSWAWNPPIVPMPDGDSPHAGQSCIKIGGEANAKATVSPCHTVALRPSTRYRFSGAMKADEGAGIAFDLGGPRMIEGKMQWTPFQVEFTASADQWWLSGPTFRGTGKGAAWLKDLSLKEAAGGPELLWEADVNRPLFGTYNQPDCFMLDKVLEAAEQGGVRLQVVLFTRNPYMPLLGKEGSRDYDTAVAMGKRLVRYCVARWGYSTHVAAWEYFNEMNPGLPTNRFYAELGETFEQIDVNRHLRATSTWSSPSKDYQHHKLDTADLHYYMRPADKELFKDAAAAVLARWKLMQQHVRGRPLLFSEFGLADDKWRLAPEIGKDKEYVFLHDALWASALSGFASTVCPWWWEDIDKKDMYHHYRPVAAFVADIPFTTAGLQPASAMGDKGLRVVGLQAGDRAYLWVNDPQATWWRIGMEGVQPGEVKGAALTVEGLGPGSYTVQWWDTREGKVIRQEAAKAAGGPLRLAAPLFSRDIACKVVKAGL